ncbi:zonular occludens toxin domain-containing protein [Variovorax sp. 350MFTsu5.1]|uniref:zonular occludens toxin domain-containing protein n=1 Tax=Variovorax sp. 350MFTsu5.1 TaxID=3158365 RepID=UPI003AAC28FA
MHDEAVAVVDPERDEHSWKEQRLMLTVWTGLPGSGKTSGVIEKVLMPLAAKGWIEHAVDAEGNAVEVKRKLFTNINGLLLEHEKIDADDLNRWQEWVKPGDLIVFDEVQKPWPLTGANKEQPKCITELETHRHYGIDMHLLTQHPMLINAAIVRLAGQHFHIRKLGNSRYATIYEWDGVSRTLLYKNSFSKKPWRRSKKAEEVYRSSSLHTKQKRSLPTVIFGILIAVVMLGFLGPTVYGRLHERFNPKPVEAAKTESKGEAPVQVVAAAAGPASPVPAPLVGAAASPVFAGCARIRERCQCFDEKGKPFEKEKLFCEDMTRVAVGMGAVLDHLRDDGAEHRERLARLSWANNDREVLTYMGQRATVQAQAAVEPSQAKVR